MRKECMNCCYYEKYYTKSTYYFEKQRNGLCQVEKQSKNNHDACERWKCKNVKNMRSLRRELCAKVINEMASDLSEIRQILKEEREDECAERAAEEQKNR